MRAILAWLVLLSLQIPAIGADKYHGAFTGETLLKSYLGPPVPRGDPFLKGGDLINHEMARAYMNGIKDVTEGTAWCYTSGKPHELNDDIAAALAKIPLQEQKGPAGPLVVKVLAQLFPCARGERSK